MTQTRQVESNFFRFLLQIFSKLKEQNLKKVIIIDKILFFLLVASKIVVILDIFQLQNVLDNVVLIEELIDDYLIVILDLFALNNKESGNQVHKFVYLDIQEVRGAQFVLIVVLKQVEQNSAYFADLVHVGNDYTTIITINLFENVDHNQTDFIIFRDQIDQPSPPRRNLPQQIVVSFNDDVEQEQLPIDAFFFFGTILRPEIYIPAQVITQELKHS